LPESTLLGHGALRKMKAQHTRPIAYSLPIGDARVDMNALLGSDLKLEWHHEIRCVHCGRITSKSFNQGYCYPCFKGLAQCDQCIVKPELCHHHLGTCREPAWGEANCLQPHTVYLANSSGLKVGITRGLDATTRWIDQGATQAMAIRVVPDRRSSGTLEVMLKSHVADKTNWRKMLKSEPQLCDLEAERDRLMAEMADASPQAVIPGEPRADVVPVQFDYPVLRYPDKVTSHNLDKNPVLKDTLAGIKGQYLIFADCVINVRKYGGYVVSLQAL